MLDKCDTLTDAGLSALGEHLPTGALDAWMEVLLVGVVRGR